MKFFKKNKKTVLAENEQLKSTVAELNQELEMTKRRLRELQKKQHLFRLDAAHDAYERGVHTILSDIASLHKLNHEGVMAEASAFEILKDEESDKWGVVTEYCQMCGRPIATYFNDETVAKLYALCRTMRGHKPGNKGVCHNCFPTYANGLK